MGIELSQVTVVRAKVVDWITVIIEECGFGRHDWLHKPLRQGLYKKTGVW